MRLMRPRRIPLADLISSTVSETTALYNAGTTYAANALARVDAADGAVEYESLVGSNLGNPVSDATKWRLVGSTNRWRALDGKINAQSSRAESLQWVFRAGGRIDGLSLLNLDAVSVTVTCEDDDDGVVFTKTVSLVATYGIVDLYSYLTEPIRRRTDVFVDGISPLYSNLLVTVTVTAPGGTAKIGEIVPSLSRRIGGTRYGLQVGIRDFSTKDTDSFGEPIVVERAWSKRATFVVNVAPGLFDQVYSELASYRAQPIVYLGATQYGASLVYGYFRDFTQEVEGPTSTTCSLEVEGLSQ